MYELLHGFHFSHGDIRMCVPMLGCPCQSFIFQARSSFPAIKSIKFSFCTGTPFNEPSTIISFDVRDLNIYILRPVKSLILTINLDICMSKLPKFIIWIEPFKRERDGEITFFYRIGRSIEIRKKDGKGRQSG